MQKPLRYGLPGQPAEKFPKAARWGRVLAVLALLLIGGGTSAWAQATRTLPGSYVSFSDAITDINANFPNGGVTVSVAADYSEAPTTALPALTAQGTGGVAGQIVFRKSGTGLNPKITASWTGTTTTVDAIITLSGADYVTFDGIDLADLTSHVTQTTAMEAGFALFRPTATNGSQNNTIQNCVVTMNRSNLTTSATTGVPYGIYGASTDATGTAVATTSAAGTNSNNKFYANSIQNTQMGIYLLGFADATSPYALLDQGNDVGGTAVATGNTIQNFGGIAAVTAYGIRMGNQNGGNSGYNAVSNAANGGVVSPSTFYGIQFTGGANGSCTASNNTITISQGLNNSQVVAIQTVLAGTGTTTVNTNTVNFSLTATGGVANTSARFLLINGGATGTLNMNGNTVNCSLSIAAASTNVSGGAYGVNNQGAVTGNVSMSNNTVTYTLNNSSSSTLSSVCGAVFNQTAIAGNLTMTGNTVSITSSNTSTGTISSALYGAYNSAAIGGTATLNTNVFTHAGTNTSTGTFSSVVNAVYNSGTVTGLLTFSGNTYLNSTTATTGTIYLVYANSSTNNLLVQNNTLNSLNKTGAGGTVYGYYNNGGGAGTATMDGNAITNITLTGATAFNGLYSSSASTQALVATNNTMTGITAGTSASLGISFTSTSFTGAVTATGNTIAFITAGAALTGIGVASQAGTATISNNTLNLTSTAGACIGINATSIVAQTINGNTITGISGAAAVTGIVAGGTSTQTVAQNIIGGLRGTTSVLVGLSVSAGTTNTVTGNKLYDFALTGASTVTGLAVSSGTTTLANNLVGDLRAPVATSATGVTGLQVSGGTTVNVYYNTIYLAAAGAATFGSSGIYLSSTTPTVLLINNIVDNKSTPGATSGLTVALRRSATAVTGYASTSNYNLYYAGAPAANRLLYYDGTNSYQTLAAWQAGTGIAPREAASKTEDVTFASTTGSDATFLHINPSVATQVESGGVAISGITTDFDGDTRNATTPDIGADEGSFTPNDQTPPTIAYTALGNTGSTASRTLTATIADASGVATGAGAPRIYYRLSTDPTYFGAVATAVAGSSYTFTIDYANIGGAPAGGTTIQYYVAAQDASVNSNVASSPTGGAGISPPGGTAPAAPASYQILAQLAGDYYVLGTAGAGTSPGGATREYATLTAAVADYNSKGLGGAVRFLLFSNTQSPETYPISINANADASATNTLTIKPSAGVTTTLSGSSTAELILLNGADYVTIDGSNAAAGTSRDLTLTNTSTGTSSAIIWGQTTGAADAATNNVVKNLMLTGSGKTATLFGVGFGGTAVSTSSLGTANVNNTVQNNSVGLVQYGIYSQGASLANKNTGTVITQNLLGTSAGALVGYGGIVVGFEDGINISLNTIDNITSAGSPDVVGINAGFGANGINAGTFTGNEVTNATIVRNRVGVVKNTGTYSAAGIALASAATGTSTIANNFVSGVSANGTGGDFGAGIYLGGGAGTTQVYYNSVWMSGTNGGSSAGTYPSIALAIGGSNPVVNVRNNALANTQTTGTANYNAAIGLAYSTYTNLTSDYNDLYVGTGTYYVVGITGGFNTTAPTTSKSLSIWQTTTSKDASSKSLDPVFTSATDLHSASPDLDNAGTPITPPIAGITTVDIDGDARSATTPDIGADEFAYVDNQAPTITYTALGNTTSTANRTLTATITDVSGVAMGAGAPLIYYRKGSSGAYVSAVATSTAVNGLNNGTYTFTLDYTAIGGVAAGDVVQYYVAAQDASLASNVATSPTGGTGISPPGSTAPAGPNAYTIFGPLPVAISVGTGQTYASLTNTGGLFEAINGGTLSGNTTATITSDLTGELGTVALGPLPDGGNGYTLTIKSDGTLRSITGSSSAATGLVRLAGASRVTFTGAQPTAASQSLLFRNGNSAAPAFNLTADASNNTLANLLVESANTSATSGTIVLGSGTSTGNSNNLLTNLDIRSAANVTSASYANGVYSAGLSSTVLNSGNTVSNSLLHNFSGSGVFVSTNSTGWTVSGNSLYQEASRSTATIAVRLATGNGHTISTNSVYQTAGTLTGAFTGISLIGGGTGHLVQDNYVGGATATATGTTLAATGATNGILLTVGTSAATSVQGNVVRALSSTGGTSLIAGIQVTAGMVNVGTVTGNIVGNAGTGQGLGASYVGRGISVTSTVPVAIRNNHVLNLNTTSNAQLAVYLYGVFVNNTSTTTVANNTINGVTNASLVDDTNDDGPLTRGIFSSATGVITVQDNQVANVVSTAAATGVNTSNSYNYITVQGILLYQAGSASQVARNRVWNVSSSSNGTGLLADEVYGVQLSSTTGVAIANNQLSLLASVATAPFTAGIYDASGSNTIAFNSVYLAGAGASGTFAYYRGGTTATTLRNNIFYNARTGSGSNYAVATGSATGFVGSTTNPGPNTSDYNLFFTADAAKVGLYGTTGYSFAGWKTISSGDGSSMSETSAVVLAASLFASPATGDLALAAGSPAAWYANGTGVQVASIGTDYLGTARPTTVAAGAPDIGSAEVTPTATPPAMAVSAAPVAGGTQMFTLGGRTLVSLTYGSAGTVPTSVVARYYSGTNPPAPFVAGAKYANAYFTFSNDNSDGSAYTYQPTLSYDPALLGTIVGETAQRISQRTASNSGYATFASTVVNTLSRTLAGPATLDRLGLLAISDAASPLPVQLVRFEATRQGTDALLDWATATELDNQGFDVQVSLDGQSFRSLAFVAGAGSSATPRSYRFADHEASKAGLRYYRLRQVDRQGTATFSPVRTALFEAPAAQLVAWPNPYQQAVRLSVVLPLAAPSATLTLLDGVGRQVLRQELGPLPAGLSEPALDPAAFGRLPVGIYVLRLSTPAGTQVLKLIKE
ncbi:beta strand repeat-containing protein [Hymenobacter artigasi]|uniref:T9SS type A sorting domain-containing protein n=1 Tax=Hymenobacter artigasi TaxID=2719616 RepID=A0ABX1HMA0_9BACT|nr:right-handed parallel beta-helix repeat-containing protein [Hymenobacter artigasi]NKI90257.1 hypothetical protein [Hymenobacter artigasi]